METQNLFKKAISQSARVHAETGKISEGILLVDKPSGVSSHRVVNWVRKNSGIKKVGHTGTLDPLATGLLILLIGREYTKQQNVFLKQNKSYTATVQLGVSTDSYDTQGTILHQNSWEELSQVSQPEVHKVVASFLGKYKQQVPIFSAVKVDGQKLYEIAHAAQYDPKAQEEYKRFMQKLPYRKVDISEITLTHFCSDKTQRSVSFSISVSCSSGTYIRSLAVDIGKKLGLHAMVTQLRRTAVANIPVSQAQICPVITFNRK